MAHQTIEHDTHRLIVFDAWDKRIGLAPSPELADIKVGASAPVHFLVKGALDGLIALNDEIAKQRKLLSDDGVRDKVAQSAPKIAEKVSAGLELLRMWSAQNDATEAALYAPPALDPTDMVSALADRERRDWFERLTSENRTRFTDQLRAGKHPGVVESFARSPVPGMTREVGLGYWRAAVEQRSGPQIQAIKARRAAIEWGESAFAAVSRTIVAVTPKPTSTSSVKAA